MIELKEYNEAGTLLSTYVHSEGQLSELKKRDAFSRVDVVPPKEREGLSLVEKLQEVLLPAGYPHSVTEDYLEYKIYDALQAFSSTIAGMLASRAVLQGVGVGDATASPTGALLLTVFQESAGRIATILFAHKLGTSIEPECKMYRLAADLFNDAAMIADCLSPILPKPLRVTAFCASSVMRALCGTAACSSKATLTAHFSKWGNIGELNAKEASQGNVISLLGMLVGSLVVSRITSPWATWIAMLLLLTIHLSMNYAAVRAVSMHSLNRQRANILFSHLIAYGKVLRPVDVKKRERIFERTGVLRWTNDIIIGHGQIGVSLQDIVCTLARSQHPRTKSLTTKGPELGQLLDIYDNEEYILWYDYQSFTTLIVLKKGVHAQSQLKAWCQGLIIARKASQQNSCSLDSSVIMTELAASLERATELVDKHIPQIRSAGWLTDVTALETQARKRRLICMH